MKPVLAAMALVATLGATLAACVIEKEPAMPATPPVSAPANPPVETQCKAEELQGLIGQSASVLETMRFAGPMRVIRPGMAVTMDFKPERLNIHIDRDEMISRVTCG